MILKNQRLQPQNVCSRISPEALLALALAFLKKLFAVHIPLHPASQPVNLFQVNGA